MAVPINPPLVSFVVIKVHISPIDRYKMTEIFFVLKVALFSLEDTLY